MLDLRYLLGVLALRSCLACLLLFGAASNSGAGVFRPEGLREGDVYHLIFTTAGQRDATSTDLSEYQRFVAEEAQLSDLTRDCEWWPLVSVAAPVDSSIDARSFIHIEGPIYNMKGELFSDNGLFTDDESNGIVPSAAPNYDQFGRELNAPFGIATGTNVAGKGQDPLGGRFITVGSNNDLTDNDWLVADDEPDTQLYHFYAVSKPIVVPEPGSLFSLSLALLILSVGRRTNSFNVAPTACDSMRKHLPGTMPKSSAPDAISSH